MTDLGVSVRGAFSGNNLRRLAASSCKVYPLDNPSVNWKPLGACILCISQTWGHLLMTYYWRICWQTEPGLALPTRFFQGFCWFACLKPVYLATFHSLPNSRNLQHILDASYNEGHRSAGNQASLRPDGIQCVLILKPKLSSDIHRINVTDCLSKWRNSFLIGEPVANSKGLEQKDLSFVWWEAPSMKQYHRNFSPIIRSHTARMQRVI